MKTKEEILKEKSKDKNYLKELQRFFDLADNIENEKLKKKIIYQMLRCDEAVTKLYKNRV